MLQSEKALLDVLGGPALCIFFYTLAETLETIFRLDCAAFG